MRSFKRIMRPAVFLSIVVSVWISVEMVLAIHNEDGHLSFIMFVSTCMVAILSAFLLLAWIIATVRYGPRFINDLKDLSIMRDGVQWLEKNAYFGLYTALIAKIIQLLFKDNDFLCRVGAALFPTGIFILCLCGGTCLILVTLKKLGFERLVTNKRTTKIRRKHSSTFSNYKFPR